MRNLVWEKNEFKLWILLLCAYHFFPFITTRGSIILYAWAYLIPIIYIVCNLNYLCKIVSAFAYSEAFICIVGIMVLACGSILIPIIYGTGDFTYFTESILGLVKILVRMLFICIVILKNIPNATKETFMKYFVFSCCLYICSTFLMISLPGLKDLFYEIVKETEHAKLMAMDPRYTTRYGWAGFSGFEYTFKCVLAIIFTCYLLERKIKENRAWIYVGIALFLLIGTLFYGRIGSLFGLGVLCVLFLRLLKKRPKILIGVIICGVLACIGLFILQSRSESVRTWFEWAFDLLVTFIETGKLQTDSSNVLIQQMLFIPEPQTLLFGDGMYSTATGYYMETDAGIMRTLLFGGIGFALFRYLIFYLPLSWKILNRDTNKEQKWLFLWVLLLCIIFEIKGEILFSCIPVFIWVFMIDKYKKMEGQKWSEI